MPEKSTLLSAVSAAEPKIADYPSLTMEPQLGIVSYPDNRSFVTGGYSHRIIEGASGGRGLGLRFLRHIKRKPYCFSSWYRPMPTTYHANMRYCSTNCVSLARSSKTSGGYLQSRNPICLTTN